MNTPNTISAMTHSSQGMETGPADELPAKALTIRQPWAWHIVNSGKNIENRTWHTAFRGPICIHAGANRNKREFNSDRDDSVYLGGFSPKFEEIPLGGIVAIAEVVDCVTSHHSPWFFGPYGFVLKNVTPVKFIPVKGMLGIFGWKSRIIERSTCLVYCPLCGSESDHEPSLECTCHLGRPPCGACTDGVFVCPRCAHEWEAQ